MLLIRTLKKQMQIPLCTFFLCVKYEEEWVKVWVLIKELAASLAREMVVVGTYVYMKQRWLNQTWNWKSNLGRPSTWWGACKL